MGWGKTRPAHLSIYLSVFWIMYLNSFDLYQAENEVFKLNSLLVLLHCGVGKDLAGLQNVSSFLFYLSSFWLCYSYMNTYEWPISKNYQVFKPNGLFVLLHWWMGKEWAYPFSPPPLQNVRTCLFTFQSLGLCYFFTESEDWWMTCSKEIIKFTNQKVYWYPPKCSNLCNYLKVNELFLPNSGWGKTHSNNHSNNHFELRAYLRTYSFCILNRLTIYHQILQHPLHFYGELGVVVGYFRMKFQL